MEKGTKFPLCLEGERACPPEDYGGPWGFADYLEALADPKHEQHDELLEWRGTAGMNHEQQSQRTTKPADNCQRAWFFHNLI